MDKKDFKLGNNTYAFINEYGSRGNRGFYYKTTLFCNNYNLNEYKTLYVNRTWECYTYQSVMQSCVYSKIEQIRNKAIKEYKTINNIKRLTKKHNDNVEMLCKKNEYYNDLKKLYKLL